MLPSLGMTIQYIPLFLDTETTGADQKDRLCQLAYTYTPSDSTDRVWVDELFLPPLPIAIEAMSVHHITQEMVNDKPPFGDSGEKEKLQNLLDNEEYILVAHNAPFDIGMLLKEGMRVPQYIDTLKIARALDPHMKFARHSLQYLRYALKLDTEIEGTIIAHDAKGDVLVLEALFNRLFKKVIEKHDGDTVKAFEWMMETSTKPSLIAKIPFGKHKGSFIKDLAQTDRGYLEWLLGQKKNSEEDETDWIFTLEYYLNKPAASHITKSKPQPELPAIAFEEPKKEEIPTDFPTDAESGDEAIEPYEELGEIEF